MESEVELSIHEDFALGAVQDDYSISVTLSERLAVLLSSFLGSLSGQSSLHTLSVSILRVLNEPISIGELVAMLIKNVKEAQQTLLRLNKFEHVVEINSFDGDNTEDQPTVTITFSRDEALLLCAAITFTRGYSALHHLADSLLCVFNKRELENKLVHAVARKLIVTHWSYDGENGVWQIHDVTPSVEFMQDLDKTRTDKLANS